MPARKMRVELFDGEGNKYSVAFEGQITREKALRLLDLVELLGGGVSPETNLMASNNRLSKYEKIRTLVQKTFPIVWFSSKEVQVAYEQEFKEPISLSTVATYFARMANKGLLMKAGAPNRLKYKFVQTIPQTVIKQKIS
jgi:hypothetical protein